MKRILFVVGMLLTASPGYSADITWADKATGGTFTAADANEVKSAVNSKADKENISFLAGDLSDLKITTTAQPVTGENIITASPSEKTKQTYTAAAIDTLVAAGGTGPADSSTIDGGDATAATGTTTIDGGGAI
jgi:hypothetical protein